MIIATCKLGLQVPIIHEWGLGDEGNSEVKLEFNFDPQQYM